MVSPGYPCEACPQSLCNDVLNANVLVLVNVSLNPITIVDDIIQPIIHGPDTLLEVFHVPLVPILVNFVGLQFSNFLKQLGNLIIKLFVFILCLLGSPLHLLILILHLLHLSLQPLNNGCLIPLFFQQFLFLVYERFLKFLKLRVILIFILRVIEAEFFEGRALGESKNRGLGSGK